MLIRAGSASSRWYRSLKVQTKSGADTQFVVLGLPEILGHKGESLNSASELNRSSIVEKKIYVWLTGQDDMKQAPIDSRRTRGF